MRSTRTADDDWKERAVHVSSGPAYLTVLSTGRCNLACFMCSHSFIKETPVVFTVNMLTPWLKNARRVFLAGGEPLWMTDAVNRAAKEIFECLVRDHPNVKINAYTNGVLLDERMAEMVMERFETIQFSVDSVNPAVYAKVRGRPLLTTVLENMERLAEMKRKRGLASADHPHINMNTIVMRSTVKGLPDVAQMLARLGGNKHCLVKLRDTIGHDHAKMAADMLKENRMPDTPENRAAALKTIAANQAAILEEIYPAETVPPAVAERLNGIYAANGITVEDQGYFLGGGVAKPLPSGADAVCSAPWVTADIREDGNVYCCCAHTEILGNVKERSFDEIWNGPKIKAIRAAFIRGEMKGCIQSGCPSVFDYFKVGPQSYSSLLLDNLLREWDGTKPPSSIIMLRSAPDYQSHLVARTLLRAFPGARLTVVTNQAGEASCRAWGVENMAVLAYPGATFTPEEFSRWWRPPNGDHSLAALLYNREDHTGYGSVEEVLRSIGAGRALGIAPGGALTRL
ncbi:MAG: radical SAM protein [Nitrospinae bacterium]|nr:radical SAM protein [Nitrospinota bacterium]